MLTGLILVAFAASACSQRLLGSIPVPLAGFSNIFEHEGNITDPKDRYSVVLAAFDPNILARDTTYLFRGIGHQLDDLGGVDVAASVVGTNLLWPREPSQTPLEVFGFEAINSPEGFLVPFKNQGTINIIDLRDPSNPDIHDIVSDSEGDQKDWFYHRVIWKDMDGDDDLDAVTCRARVELISGIQESEFVWFEHPEGDVFDGPWSANIMGEDLADTFLAKYTFTDTSGEEVEAIFTLGYFSSMLAVHWSTHPDGLWTDNSQIQTRIIGDAGQYFGIEVSDVNNDGRLDLLLTVNAPVNGSVWVYEIPEDFVEGEYVRHMLADGFISRSGLQGGGAPGSAGIFYPDTNSTNGKPDIFLSGDDEGTAYYMRPQSEDPDNWEYDLIVLRDEGELNIIGQLSAVDIDGDGFTELFVPSWDAGALYVFTFEP